MNPIEYVGEYAGEVIESSTSEIIAEARQLDTAPAFGSLVHIEADFSTVGVVFNISTQSIEPGRKAMAFGMSAQELRMQQPQIFELLRTHFQVHVLGYMEGADPVQVLPPQPAPIHSFVYECDDELVRKWTASDEYLRSLLNRPAQRLPADDLIIALVRRALRAHDFDHGAHDFGLRTGKQLARLLRDDYDRLGSILRRIAANRRGSAGGISNPVSSSLS
jgi:hypothetical protein